MLLILHIFGDSASVIPNIYPVLRALRALSEANGAPAIFTALLPVLLELLKRI